MIARGDCAANANLVGDSELLAKFLGLASLAAMATTTTAHSACLKDANITRHKPDLTAHVEEIGRPDGSIVSIYRQEGGGRFLEVVRHNKCVASVKVLSAEQLSQRYDLDADSWDERGIAQEEALDNEGMPEEQEAEFSSDQEAPASDAATTEGVLGANTPAAEKGATSRELANFYGLYLVVRACFESKEVSVIGYIDRMQMENAKDAIQRIESDTKSKIGGKLDTDATWGAAQDHMKDTVGLLHAKASQYSSEMKKICDISYSTLLKNAGTQSGALKKDF